MDELPFGGMKRLKEWNRAWKVRLIESITRNGAISDCRHDG